MNITPFPTLSPATIDAINVIGQWLAQDDFSGEVPYQADCVILAGNAVMPTIDAACKIARWICPYISRHLLSLNPLLACCRRYSRGER